MATRAAMVSQRVVCACRSCAEESALTALRDEGFEIEACADGAAFLEAVVRRPPDAVVFAIGQDTKADLGVLQLFRRRLDVRNCKHGRPSP